MNGVKNGKVFPGDTQDKEQAVVGVRDDDIWENGVRMVAAVVEAPEDTEIRFFFSAGSEVNDGSAVVVMDVAFSGASKDGIGLQFVLKLLHVGVKKRF